MEYIRFSLRINKKINNELLKVSKKMGISKNSLINFIITKQISYIKNEYLKED